MTPLLKIYMAYCTIPWLLTTPHPTQVDLVQEQKKQCPQYHGVHCREVSTRREFTVLYKRHSSKQPACWCQANISFIPLIFFRTSYPLPGVRKIFYIINFQESCIPGVVIFSTNIMQLWCQTSISPQSFNGSFASCPGYTQLFSFNQLADPSLIDVADHSVMAGIRLVTATLHLICHSESSIAGGECGGCRTY